MNAPRDFTVSIANQHVLLLFPLYLQQLSCAPFLVTATEFAKMEHLVLEFVLAAEISILLLVALIVSLDISEHLVLDFAQRPPSFPSALSVADLHEELAVMGVSEMEVVLVNSLLTISCRQPQQHANNVPMDILALLVSLNVLETQQQD